MNPAVIIPQANRKYEYIVPRTFKLHEELNYAEKPQEWAKGNAGKALNPHASYISIGSAYTEQFPMAFQPYDGILQDWNATIFSGPHGTQYGDRMYNIKVRCPSTYPQQPPQIWFFNKINLPGVDPYTGQVNVQQLIKWNKDSSIMDALCQLRQHMATAPRNLKQPAPHETYPLPNNFPRS